MDIGLITYYFSPESYATTARIGPFIESWRDAGDKVHVFTHRRTREGDDPFARMDHVDVHRTPTDSADNTRSLPVRFAFELAFSLSVVVAALRHQVDVWVGTSPPFLVAVTTMLLSKLTGTPYVLDVRDLFPEQLFAYDVVKRDSWFGRLLIWIEHVVYENALFVVGVTEGLVAYIEKRTTSDVVLIRNGVDQRCFSRQRMPAQAAPSSHNPFVLIFHGTLARSQNVDLMVRYGRYLKQNAVHNVILRVIGDGPKADHLVQAIDRYDLASFIDYVGAIDFEDIPDVLNDADLGFSPRLDGLVNETAFPVKVYECLGCGRPVIVTPHSEAGRYVERHDVGMQHTNDDLRGIHASVCRLKEDLAAYRAYSDRAVALSDLFDRRALGRQFREELVRRLPSETA